MNVPITESVREVVSTVMEMTPDDIGVETDLETQVGVDSMAILEIIVCLEQRFGIRYAPSDADRMATVRDIADLTEQYLRRPGGPARSCPAQTETRHGA